MITLYLFGNIAIALATFETMESCVAAERHINNQEWYAEFNTLCIEEVRRG